MDGESKKNLTRVNKSAASTNSNGIIIYTIRVGIFLV